jgi:hypothetical protein
MIVREYEHVAMQGGVGRGRCGTWQKWTTIPSEAPDDTKFGNCTPDWLPSCQHNHFENTERHQSSRDVVDAHSSLTSRCVSFAYRDTWLSLFETSLAKW